MENDLDTILTNCSPNTLKGISLVLSSIGACSLSVAMAMDMWLLTSEPFVTHAQQAEPNSTVILKTTLHASSGLWRLCINHDIQELGAEASRLPESCASEDVWSQPWAARLQDTPTTHAILRGMRRSVLPMAVSYFLLLAGFCATVCSIVRLHCLLMVGAVLFIFSTLVMSVGMIMLMGVVHEEVGTRRIPFIENVDHSELAFTYQYGVSFALVALTFLVQSLAAVCNVYVYESRFKQSPDMLAMMVPGLVIVNKQDQHTNQHDHQVTLQENPIQKTVTAQPTAAIGQMALV